MYKYDSTKKYTSFSIYLVTNRLEALILLKNKFFGRRILGSMYFVAYDPT